MPEVRFRKRPVEVTAIQWTGSNEAELRLWCGPSMFGACGSEGPSHDPEVTAHVLDVLHATWVGVKTGQWIVRGVRGQHYPIDQEVLAETYDQLGPTDGTD